MSASSSVFALGVVTAIMVVALLGMRNTWRPIRGRTADLVTKVLLVVGGTTLLATLAVWVVILRPR